MAQSPGDHNSRGPKKLLQNHTRSLSPGEKLSELEHLRSGGLSLAVAFAFLRALCVRTMVVLVGDSGGTTLRNSNFRTLPFLTPFSIFRLAYSLAPAKKEEVPPRRRLNSALSSRDAWPVPLSHWFPRSDVDPRELGPGQLTQAPEPRANPQGKDNPLSWYRTKIIL